jgi:hypothetical protein
MRFGDLPHRDKYPCNDFPDGKCPKRHPACQDTCPDMIAAKEKANARKEKERANRMKDDSAIDFQVKQSARVTRKKSRRV